jgi:cell division control protein 6
MIGIANDVKFTELLDPRVRSRLGEEKMVFPPYTSTQLRDILTYRANLVFENGAVESSVIALCAAYAAQEHGDARRALDLLRLAGEIAERRHESKVTEIHVKKAKRQLELDCVTETIRKLPTHSKLILWSILKLCDEKNTVTTGEVYHGYVELCRKTGANPLSQRRITDLISELDTLGIVQARVKSFGREGRTKEIKPSVSPVDARIILEEDEMLKGLRVYKPKVQTTLIFE